jgi:hypothetical protein
MKYTVFLLVFLMACADSERIPPADIIPRDSFVALLTDVQLLEAVSKQKMIRTDNPGPRIARYYKKTFEKFEVSEELFLASFKWYYEDPEDMISIYEEVLNELVNRQSERNQQPKP